MWITFNGSRNYKMLPKLQRTYTHNKLYEVWGIMKTVIKYMIYGIGWVLMGPLMAIGIIITLPQLIVLAAFGSDLKKEF